MVLPMSFLLSIAVILCCSSSNVHCQRVGQQRLSDKTKSALFDDEVRLNFSSASPHLFSSVHGFLRQGYNAFFPNGFAVVPCEIPAFTPLYHGWLSEDAPKSPEWLSFEPEMAYGIMGSTRNSFLSTYQTTRPTKCLYFDGSSGSLWGNGTLDTQMLLIYGNATGIPNENSSRPVSWDEYDRAGRLCGWLHEQKGNAPGGIEGIVRMNAGFELIWCNFSSPSLRLISRLNVSVPLLEYNRSSIIAEQVESPNLSSSVFDLLASTDSPYPKVEGNHFEREPFLVSQYWDTIKRMSRSYSEEDLASYKEPGIKILDGDLINFYSPEYQVFARIIAEQEKEQLNLTADGFWKGVESQQEREDALTRLMRRRSQHRVRDLNQPDHSRFQKSLKRIVSTLLQPVERFSDGNRVDRSILWSAIHDQVVNSYSKSLLQFRRLLEQDHEAWKDSWTTARKGFTLLRERSHAFLMPYLEYPTDPLLEFSFEQESRVRKQARERCKYAYMPWPVYAAPHGKPQPLLNDPIGQAIEEVMEGICSVLISIGYSIEKEWIRTFNHVPDKNAEWQEPLLASTSAWRDNIQELTAWLGWVPHWTRCEKICDWDEECYIPIWPVFRQMHIVEPAYSNFSYIDPAALEHELWHPKCLKITDFPSP